MKHFALWLLIVFCLQSCRRVVLHVEDHGEVIQFSMPFAALETALRLNGNQLEVEDLGGANCSIDLMAVAQAVRDSGSEAKMEIIDGDQTILIEANAASVQMEINSDDERVRLFLPMDAFAAMDLKNDRIDMGRVIKSLRHYQGTLLQVESPYENVTISLR